jgi:hypothetical protein
MQRGALTGPYRQNAGRGATPPLRGSIPGAGFGPADVAPKKAAGDGRLAAVRITCAAEP